MSLDKVVHGGACLDMMQCRVPAVLGSNVKSVAPKGDKPDLLKKVMS